MIAINSSNLSYKDVLSDIRSDGTELVEKLLSIGTALSGSHNLDELLHLILSKSREITWSDAGSVYLIDRSKGDPKLYFKVAQNDSLSHLSFQEFAIPLTLQSLAGYVALTGESLNIPDAYELSSHLPYRLDPTFDQDFSYRTRSVLVLPMQNQEGDIIGVLQLINRKNQPNITISPDNAVEFTQSYSPWEERVLQSLASQAAISIERNQLQDSIENLFEGFVKASVELIEMRDPTTSGHSERVADLTVRLAREASSISTGLLSSVKFSDRQIQEIRYAALLHDFGKVCVPETILNKRKKLYPEQLQIIRQRFALVQRTLEMESAEKKYQYLFSQHLVQEHRQDLVSCPCCQGLDVIEKQQEQEVAKLQHYLMLLERLNEPEAVATKRFEALSEEELAELTTLSDYCYRDINGEMKPLILPQEMEQLMIPRGNLTPEERQQIEAHVCHTYQFLKRIPWTKPLSQVPDIAYGHHEKLDGTGYPLGLTEDRILVQSQMLTIADIYDALTASDRPYKKALPVETAINILTQEAGKNKLSLELVEIFKQRQVFSTVGHSL